MNKIILIIGFAVVVSGCSWVKEKPRDVVVVTEQLDVCSTPPKADKIVMRNVDFKIIQDEFGIYWIGITPRFYENLSVNMKEITQHIKQKNAIIKYYESCHADNDEDAAEEKTEDSAPKQ